MPKNERQKWKKPFMRAGRDNFLQIKRISNSLWGQDHELLAGVNLADIKLAGRSVYTDEWNYAPVGAAWAEGNTALPEFDVYDPASQSTDIDQKQDSYYISTRLSLTDELSVLLGALTIDIEQEGVSYGAPQVASDNETVPYAGITYEVFQGSMLSVGAS